VNTMRRLTWAMTAAGGRAFSRKGPRWIRPADELVKKFMPAAVVVRKVIGDHLSGVAAVCDAASRLPGTGPLRAVGWCGQCQPDAGASKRNYPNLGYPEVLRDRRRMSINVLGGLARR
jgi:hypothetical protein